MLKHLELLVVLVTQICDPRLPCMSVDIRYQACSYGRNGMLGLL